MGTPTSWLALGEGVSPHRHSWLQPREGVSPQGKSWLGPGEGITPTALQPIVPTRDQRLADIRESQERFRAAREPAVQGQPLTLPAGARIEAARPPGVLRRLESFVRESPVGRLLGMESALTAAERARRGQPLIPATELMPGTPRLTVPVVVPPGLPGGGRRVEVPVGGIARGLAESVESLSQPENIALMTALGLTGGAAAGLGSGALRTVLSTGNRLIAAGFSYELLGNAWRQLPEFREALLQGDSQRAAELGTRIGVETGLGTAAGAHALRARPARAAGVPQRFVSEPLGESAIPMPLPPADRVPAATPARRPATLERATTGKVGVPGQEPRLSLKPQQAPRPPIEARTLPGLERAVEEQAAAAARVEGDRLSEEFTRPLEERPRAAIEGAPIFRGTEAAPQREMFQGEARVPSAPPPVNRFQVVPSDFEVRASLRQVNLTRGNKPLTASPEADYPVADIAFTRQVVKFKGRPSSEDLRFLKRQGFERSGDEWVGPRLARSNRQFDAYGDEIRVGLTAIEPVAGRTGTVRSVSPERVRLELKDGRVVSVPTADVQVKRRGVVDATKGVGRRQAQPFGREGGGEFGLSERDAIDQMRFQGGGGFEFSANPVFSPRFWQQADAALRPFTQRIDQAIGALVGRLPFSVRKWLREEPRTRQVIQQARRETGMRQSETEAVLRMVLRENPTPEELAIADRIARGVPAELTQARPEIRPVLEQAAEEVQGLAQQMTAERKALGLPVREEWEAGPKHWYPNLWQQHLLSPRMVMGRLFSLFRPGKAVQPKAGEMGSLRPRTTDRFVVVDKAGNIARTDSGQAIFRTMEEAKAFVGEHPRKALRIVEPMTHEQAVAHGLMEDLALNLKHGFGKEWSLLAKTRALETLGREFAREGPEPGYVNLGELGFNIPARLAERNPHITRLRDGYVPEDVAETLTAYYGRQGFFPSWLRAMEGSLRKWVTVRNPFRHPRQLAENHLALAFGDPKAALNVPAMRQAFRDFARGARGETDVAYWEEYKGSNLWYSDIVRGEFETVWRGVDTIQPGSVPLSLAERMALWAETNPAASRLLASDVFAEKLYRAEDQVYKYYLYRTLRERGLSPEQAEYRTSRTFFDYSDVPPIVRAANRFIPFAPNVTWQFTRILGTALRDRPATTTLKLALLLYGYAFMREQFMRAAGITEQDERNMGKLAPEWYEVPLPITDSKGRNLKVSLLWLLPFGEIFFLSDLLAGDQDVERGLVAAARKFLPMSLQPVATAVSGRGPFGEKVLRGTETREEAAEKMGWAVLKGWLPGLLGQYWDRLYQNAAAGEERQKPWWEKALVEPITGRIEHFRPEEKVDLRKALLAGRGRDVQEEAYRQRGRFLRGATTAETYREEVGKLRGRAEEPDVAHPETLAVVQALEGGRHKDARAAYSRLKQSGYYASSEEALDAIRDLLRRRARLQEMESAPLPEAKEAARAVVEELKRTGKVRRETRRQLEQALAALPESEETALLDWLEQQLSGRRQPSRELQPVVPGTELRPVMR